MQNPYKNERCFFLLEANITTEKIRTLSEDQIKEIVPENHLELFLKKHKELFNVPEDVSKYIFFINTLNFLYYTYIICFRIDAGIDNGVPASAYGQHNLCI